VHSFAKEISDIVMTGAVIDYYRSQQAVCKCNPGTYPNSSFFVSPLLFGNRRCRLPFQTQGFSVTAQ
jgi:hypothetical protein